MDYSRKINLLNFSLLKALQENRLAHGLLFSADPDQSLQSDTFLKNLIASLLCYQKEEKTQTACGRCDSCKLWSLGTHPDAIVLESENPNTGFAVDQIREFSKFFQLKQSLSNARVVHIKNAELLSLGQSGAANALLKILEEPRPNSFLILSTTRPQSILPTLKSRCQTFRIPANAELHLEISDAEKLLLNSWKPCLDFLVSATNANNPFLPPDQDSFWKDKEKAVLELQQVRGLLWKNVRKNFPDHSAREHQLHILTFFENFDDFLTRLQAFTQPHLQWLNFRTKTRIQTYANN